MIDLLVKVPSASHLEAAFYLRIQPLKRRWTLLVMGNTVQNLETEIKSYISSQGRQTCKPFAIILMIIRAYFEFVLNDANNLGYQAAVLEQTTGLGSFAYSAPPELRIEDLKTKHMSWLIGNLRIAHKALDFHTELIVFVQNEHLKFLSYEAHKAVSPDSLRGRSHDLHEAIQALKCSMDWKLRAFRIEPQDRAQSLYEGVSSSFFQTSCHYTESAAD